MQLASINFSGALFHGGGQGAYYNPFTPPPTNQSSFRQWSVGPIYYSALVMAEVLGPSNQSRIVDLNMNGGQPLTPGYAIYEGDTPTKVALFNYIDDPSGAQAYTVQLSIGGASPSSVRVKRLSASSVSQKGNYTWAGQVRVDVLSALHTQLMFIPDLRKQLRVRRAAHRRGDGRYCAMQQRNLLRYRPRTWFRPRFLDRQRLLSDREYNSHDLPYDGSYCNCQHCTCRPERACIQQRTP